MWLLTRGAELLARLTRGMAIHDPLPSEEGITPRVSKPFELKMAQVKARIWT
jgi:hypothetical protein